MHVCVLLATGRLVGFLLRTLPRQSVVAAVLQTNIGSHFGESVALSTAQSGYIAVARLPPNPNGVCRACVLSCFVMLSCGAGCRFVCCCLHTMQLSPGRLYHPRVGDVWHCIRQPCGQGPYSAAVGYHRTLPVQRQQHRQCGPAPGVRRLLVWHCGLRAGHQHRVQVQVARRWYVHRSCALPLTLPHFHYSLFASPLCLPAAVVDSSRPRVCCRALQAMASRSSQCRSTPTSQCSARCPPRSWRIAWHPPASL
jgi:hypothetical protein